MPRKKKKAEKENKEKTFAGAINPENLPATIEEQDYKALTVMVKHAAQMPDINQDELIRMCDGGELGWKIDDEDTRVPMLEDVLLWDFNPYWGKWEITNGKRLLHKRPLTDPDAEAEGFVPRIDLCVEWQGEDKIIGLPTVGYNAFVKKLELYVNRGQDIRDRRFNLKTKKVPGKHGPLTVPVFKEIKHRPASQEVIDIPNPDDEVPF